MVNLIVSLVVPLAGFILARSQLLAILEERDKAQQKEIDEIKARVNNEFLGLFREMQKKMEELNIKVSLALERIDHVSKRPLHVDQGDLNKLLEMIVEVNKR